jgi:hypothetical protein
MESNSSEKESGLIQRARAYIPPEDVDVIVYHSPCSDGYSAAYCAYKRFGAGSKIQYVKGDYKEKLDLEQFRDKNVLLLDYSFPKYQYLEAQKICKKLMIIDHHKSAIIEMLLTIPEKRILEEAQVVTEDGVILFIDKSTVNTFLCKI